MTLEDETGYANVVVWNDLVERQRRSCSARGCSASKATCESEGEVVHLVARRLVDHSRCSAGSSPLTGFSLSARDFR